jgi:hypothetical protein
MTSLVREMPLDVLRNYFISHDQLIIEDGIELKVSGVFALYNNAIQYCSQEVETGDIIRRRIFVAFGQICGFLGQGIGFATRSSSLSLVETKWSAGEDFFSILPQNGSLIIQTNKVGAVYADLRDLFQAMRTHSVETFNINKDQTLIFLGISREEQNRYATIHHLVMSRLPEKYGYKINEFASRFSSSSLPQRPHYTFQPLGKDFELSLLPPSPYLFNCQSFRALIEAEDENDIIIPPGQTFMIQDSKLIDTFAETSEFIDLLNYILLPLGKGVKKIASDLMNIVVGVGKISLYSDHGVYIKIAPINFYVDIDALLDTLKEANRSVLHFHPGQQIRLHAFDLVENAKIDSWRRDCSFNPMISGLSPALVELMFNRRAPVGFAWQVLEKTRGDLEVFWDRDEAGICFRVVSSNGWSLSLGPAGSIAGIIISILRNSSPKLLEDLLTLEARVFQYMIFRVMFYVCCEKGHDNHSDKIASFFKEDIADKLFELVGEFDSSEYMADPEFAKIATLSPEEFDAYDKEGLPVFLKKLVRISYEALEKSHPLMEQIALFIRKYQAGDFWYRALLERAEEHSPALGGSGVGAAASAAAGGPY